jgi:hypothetical protein
VEAKKSSDSVQLPIEPRPFPLGESRTQRLFGGMIVCHVCTTNTLSKDKMTVHYS